MSSSATGLAALDTTSALTDVSVTSWLCFDDLEIIANAAVNGMGHVWRPCWLIRDRVRAGDLVELWVYRPSAAMECYAVWPVAQYLLLRSRLAIDAPAADLPNRFDS